MDAHILSLSLSILAISGVATLLIALAYLLWRYRDCRRQTFRWRLRNWRLMQLSGLACLFFLAMTASYAILQEAWVWLYALIAFKTGIWWFRYAISRA